MSIGEFSDVYSQAVKSGDIPERKVEAILKTLFLFSFIGNQPRQITNQIFKYKSPEANLNFKEKICVHRGYYNALEIF